MATQGLSLEIRWIWMAPQGLSLEIRWILVATQSLEIRWILVATQGLSLEIRWIWMVPQSLSLEIRWILVVTQGLSLEIRWILVASQISVKDPLDSAEASRSFDFSGPTRPDPGDPLDLGGPPGPQLGDPLYSAETRISALWELLSAASPAQIQQISPARKVYVRSAGFGRSQQISHTIFV